MARVLARHTKPTPMNGNAMMGDYPSWWIERATWPENGGADSRRTTEVRRQRPTDAEALSGAVRPMHP